MDITILLAFVGLIFTIIQTLPILKQFKLSKNELKLNKKNEIKSNEPKKIINDIRYVYKCSTASLNDLFYIQKLGESIFGKERVSPLSLLETWFNKNPKIFYTIKKETANPQSGKTASQLVGYFLIIPISPALIEDLSKKEFRIGEITEEMIVEDNKNQKHIYIAGIVANGNYTRGWCVSHLISTLTEIIERKKVKIVYARPVTEDGKRLCQKFEFVNFKNEGILYKKSFI